MKLIEIVFGSPGRENSSWPAGLTSDQIYRNGRPRRVAVSLPTREMHISLQDVATLVTLNTENRRFVSAQNRVYSCIEIH